MPLKRLAPSGHSTRTRPSLVRPCAGCPPGHCAVSIIVHCGPSRLGSGCAGRGKTPGSAAPQTETPETTAWKHQGRPRCVPALPADPVCKTMSCHPMLFINLVLTFPKRGGGAATLSPHPHQELLVAHIHTEQSRGAGLWPDIARLFQHL